MAWELGQFRDLVLKHVEGTGLLPPQSLIDYVEQARASSLLPDFWLGCRQGLSAGLVPAWRGDGLGLEELGQVMHPWLRDASAPPLPRKRRLAPPSPSSGPSREFREAFAAEMEEKRRAAAAREEERIAKENRRIAREKERITQGFAKMEAQLLEEEEEAPVVRPSSRACLPCAACGDPDVGSPVYLHVYDVSNERKLQRLNKVLAHRRAPIKFGGVFHVGVEVGGVEWSYGYAAGNAATGVMGEEPRTNPDHHFRQTVCLRATKLSGEEVTRVLAQLVEEYRGGDYELLRRNCCHFAEDFARRLGVRRIPRWVHRLARLGARLDGVLHVAQGFRRRTEVLHVDRRAAAGGA